jgi:ATP-dependent protease Clp ATPase subunit
LEGVPGAAVAAASIDPAEGEDDDVVAARRAAQGDGFGADDAEAAAEAALQATALITPRAIYEKLNEHVIGQHRVKMALSVGVFNHYKRVFEAASPPKVAAAAGAAATSTAAAELAAAAEIGAKLAATVEAMAAGQPLSLAAARARVRSSAKVKC